MATFLPRLSLSFRPLSPHQGDVHLRINDLAGAGSSSYRRQRIVRPESVAPSIIVAEMMVIIMTGWDQYPRDRKRSDTVHFRPETSAGWGCQRA